ncbi:MAG: glutamate--tRNA ligase [Candidatus Woesearchaeota archaeon]
MDIEKLILTSALENAIKFKGKASPGSIIPKVLGADPTAKTRMKEISQQINKVVGEVNALSLEEQNAKLLELIPDFFEKENQKKQERKAARRELPELKGAEMGKVVTRISPEPSKYNHLGHAVSFLLNYLYAKKYEGKCLLRFEDTNPEKSADEYVKAMREDVLKYLDIQVDGEVIVSDHMQTYYEFAERLINAGDAYTCSCPSEEISQNRRNMVACACRDKTPEEVMKEWKEMCEGDLPEGSMTLRLKVDMAHKNAVMRDPVIFRMSFTPHYRTNEKYKCWPMYDFENAIEEGLMEVTHVLRSNEFESRIELQDHIRSLFGLPNPVVKQYARFNITGAVTQGREIRELIETGNYIGWDDPRLVTLRALRRRGIVKEAFYELAKTVGMSQSSSQLDFSVIAALNRSILDEKAKRFFCIADGITITVEGAPTKTCELHLHPHHHKGGRTFNVTDSFIVSEADIARLKDGELFRLMDCINVRKKGDSFVFEGEDVAVYKKEGKNIIHWLPNDTEQLREIEIRMPDNSLQKAFAEKTISEININDVVQFERFAFCRLDAIGNVPQFWFTHQ